MARSHPWQELSSFCGICRDSHVFFIEQVKLFSEGHFISLIEVYVYFYFKNSNKLNFFYRNKNINLIPDPTKHRYLTK